MNYQTLFSYIREGLTKEVRKTIEAEDNCIGTYFKNKGVRIANYPASGENEEQYPTSPKIIVCHTEFYSQDGLAVVQMKELFINSDGMLMCVVDEKSSNCIELPIETVTLDGLYEIYKWLVKYDFIISQPTEVYRCNECGSTDVEITAWVKPNCDNEYVEDCTDNPTRWCKACGKEVSISLHEEFMEQIEMWWKDDATGEDQEVITGLSNDDYDSEEEFQCACNDIWNAKSDDEKIYIWRTIWKIQRNCPPVSNVNCPPLSFSSN